MPTQTVQEPVDVGALFRRGAKPAPKWFVWNGRKYVVKAVAMTWASKEGESPLLHYSVTAGADAFDLCLNQKTLLWSLEKIHLEG